MDLIWAGWRMAYIKKSTAKGAREAPCLFCAKGRFRPGRRQLILAKTPRVIVMLNLYPYNVAHVLVAPRRHHGSLTKLSAEESVEITQWLGRVERAIKRAYKAQGFNIGLNLGRVAGAGVLGHLHWHVVPRWSGDTNFMPMTARTKVMPESLDRTYERVSKALAALDGRGKKRARR